MVDNSQHMGIILMNSDGTESSSAASSFTLNTFSYYKYIKYIKLRLKAALNGPRSSSYDCT